MQNECTFLASISRLEQLEVDCLIVVNSATDLDNLACNHLEAFCDCFCLQLLDCFNEVY